MRIFRIILRILLGALFIGSAIAKLVSVDSFEIYIFSFEIIPLGLSFIAARLVIVAEFALGLWMICGSHSKASVVCAMAMTGAFSLFLLILIALGSKENCHCFGELVNFTPMQSLLKNIALLLLLTLCRNSESFSLPKRGLWPIAVTVASLATVFIVSPPDNWNYKGYSVKGFNSSELLKLWETDTPEKESEAALRHIPLFESIVSGSDKIVCFFSLQCPYCRLSAKKLGVLIREGRFGENAQVVCFLPDVEYKGEVQTPEEYFEENKLLCTEFYTIPAETFVRAMSGNMPSIIHFRDGQFVEEFGYRDLH